MTPNRPTSGGFRLNAMRCKCMKGRVPPLSISCTVADISLQLRRLPTRVPIIPASYAMLLRGAQHRYSPRAGLLSRINHSPSCRAAMATVFVDLTFSLNHLQSQQSNGSISILGKHAEDRRSRAAVLTVCNESRNATAMHKRHIVMRLEPSCVKNKLMEAR